MSLFPSNMIVKARAILLVVFALLAFVFFLRPNTQQSSPSRYVARQDAKVAKVSMLYGEPNDLYVSALESHKKHNDKFNYDFHILQNDVTGDYWNKLFWIQSLIVQELAKAPGDRVEWLMWVDADLILVNPSVPLEIFLPPEDFSHIHFLGNKDQNGLNTGTFFIRTHEWSVKMLAKAISFPIFRPEVDLHVSVDQEAMQHVFNESEFSQHILFQPRIWYNTYEFHHGYEGEKGNLLVHFPGLEEDRWPHMREWLERLRTAQSEWDVDVESTKYPQQLSEYWTIMRNCYTTLLDIDKSYRERAVEMSPQVKQAFDRAWSLILYEADVPKAIEDATEVLKQVASF